MSTKPHHSGQSMLQWAQQLKMLSVLRIAWILLNLTLPLLPHPNPTFSLLLSASSTPSVSRCSVQGGELEKPMSYNLFFWCMIADGYLLIQLPVLILNLDAKNTHASSATGNAYWSFRRWVKPNPEWTLHLAALLKRPVFCRNVAQLSIPHLFHCPYSKTHQFGVTWKSTRENSGQSSSSPPQVKPMCKFAVFSVFPIAPKPSPSTDCFPKSEK